MVNGYAKAIKSLWNGTCTIIVRKPVTNEANGRTELKEFTELENEPCRLSFKNVNTTGENNEASPVQQVTELIISNEVVIPAGSKLIITQNGRIGEYEKSGEPAVYSVHQEIIIEKFKEWA